LQTLYRSIGYAINPSKFLPRTLKSFLGKITFNIVSLQMRRNILFQGKTIGYPVFCIVHWNAPDYLILNVNQIRNLYPNSKIYILDNGSQQQYIDTIKKDLNGYDNVTLFAATPKHRKFISKIGLDRLLYCHLNGLQFLLNFAAESGDQIAIFLDQDCILSSRIDSLLKKLNEDILLIGPKTGDLNLVHASFMALQPIRIHQLFGKFSFFHEKTDGPEPYHGLSLKIQGKILFLKTSRHEKIPALSAYSNEDQIFAWHAWYSSRTVGCSDETSLDGTPISFLRKVREQSIEFLRKINEKNVTMYTK